MRVRIVAAIAGILLASSAWAQWNLQTIDNEFDAGLHSRMVEDSLGRPHVLYVTHSGGNQNVMHTWWTGSGWQTEHVFDYYGQGYSALSEDGVDCAIDRHGGLHACWTVNYWYNSDTYLYYATKVGGVWRDTKLDMSDGRGERPATMAADTSGNPHIIDCHPTGRLQHWWMDSSGSWHVEQFQTGSNVPKPSMMIDSQNKVYAAYSRGGNLELAYRDGTGWGTQIVDIGGSVGQFCSIKKDESGHVCISYYDATNGDLKYAVGTPTH